MQAIGPLGMLQAAGVVIHFPSWGRRIDLTRLARGKILGLQEQAFVVAEEYSQPFVAHLHLGIFSKPDFARRSIPGRKQDVDSFLLSPDERAPVGRDRHLAWIV